MSARDGASCGLERRAPSHRRRPSRSTPHCGSRTRSRPPSSRRPSSSSSGSSCMRWRSGRRARSPPSDRTSRSRASLCRPAAPGRAEARAPAAASRRRAPPAQSHPRQRHQDPPRRSPPAHLRHHRSSGPAPEGPWAGSATWPRGHTKEPPWPRGPHERATWRKARRAVPRRVRGVARMRETGSIVSLARHGSGVSSIRATQDRTTIPGARFRTGRRARAGSRS
jgi:hypothetical protein